MGSLDAGSVSSAGDLADFLRALADKMRTGKSEENPISADFVEAAAAWCDDMPGTSTTWASQRRSSPPGRSSLNSSLRRGSTSNARRPIASQ
jgi:hypothetical protein